MSRLTEKQKQDRARLRSIKLAERTAKSCYFSSVYGTGEKVQPHDMNGNPCGIRIEGAKAVELAVLPWRVVCYALCRHPVDGDYLKSMALSFSQCRQSEVNRALSEAHYDWMVRECNISQVLTLAWIATTADEPSDYIATKIFGDAWGQFDPVVMMEDGKYQTRPRNDEVQAAIQE